MRPYNVEFFDRDLNFLCNDLISDLTVDDDYLAISTNSITINRTDKIKKNGFIFITGESDFFGLVTDVSDSDYSTKVSFKSILSLFDQDVLFDTKIQNDGETALEKVISNLITQYWINSGDAYQSLSILKTDIFTNTKTWNLNVTPDTDDTTYKIINLYNDIISPALSSYGVAITPVFSMSKKTLTLEIGASSQTQIIEADLPTVKIDTFTINQASSNTNKMEIWNDTNYTEKIYYYYHTDNTYDTENKNRVTPVVLVVTTASPNDGDDVKAEDKVTFAQAAKEVADSEFAGITWTNLIELTVGLDDSLINPMDLKFGQEVKIIHNGTQYPSILTGKKISTTITLTFGTVRADLTKKLKMGG